MALAWSLPVYTHESLRMHIFSLQRASAVSMALECVAVHACASLYLPCVSLCMQKKLCLCGSHGHLYARTKCMLLCMHVCMHVCLYVCIDIDIDIDTYV